MNNKIIKNYKFIHNIGHIYFFKRYSNLFLVFLDCKNQHIVTLTSGFCKLGSKKKQKIAPLNMVGIIKTLKNYLDNIMLNI